jgi:hypothetical protein
MCTGGFRAEQLFELSQIDFGTTYHSRHETLMPAIKYQ